jgi:hypothetical protein
MTIDVEEIAARLEERIRFVGDTGTLGHIDPTELTALIASWRERGEALERCIQWSEAYPLNIFPEPDLKQARLLLEAGGITLDAVSASAMRRVVNGIGKIARAALKDKP